MQDATMRVQTRSAPLTTHNIGGPVAHVVTGRDVTLTLVLLLDENEVFTLTEGGNIDRLDMLERLRRVFSAPEVQQAVHASALGRRRIDL